MQPVAGLENPFSRPRYGKLEGMLGDRLNPRISKQQAAGAMMVSCSKNLLNWELLLGDKLAANSSNSYIATLER